MTNLSFSTTNGMVPMEDEIQFSQEKSALPTASGVEEETMKVLPTLASENQVGFGNKDEEDEDIYMGESEKMDEQVLKAFQKPVMKTATVIYEPKNAAKRSAKKMTGSGSQHKKFKWM